MTLQKSGLELVAEGANEFFSALNKAEKAVNDFGDSVGDGAKKSNKGFSAIEQAAAGLGAAVGNGVKGATGAFTGLAGRASDVGQAISDADTQASAAFRGIASGADRAADNVRGLGDAAKLTATIGFGALLAGGTAIVGGLGAAAFAGLGFNNAMEQATARINAFTKDGEKTAEILEMVKARAAATPFAFEEMANAAAALGPVAISSGEDLEKLIETAEVLAASNPAEGLAGAAFALKEATSGDFTSAIERFNLSRRYINQLKEEGVPALEAVSMAMKQAGYDTDLVSSLAATAEGRWSTFQDTFTTLAGTVTQPIFDAFSSGLGSANEKLAEASPRLLELANGFGEKIAPFAAAAAESLVNFVSSSADFAAALTGDADALAKLPGPAQAVVGAIDGIAGAIAGIPAFIEDAQAQLNAFFATPLGTAIQDGAKIVADYFSGPFQSDVGNAITAVQGKFNEIAASPWGQDVQQGAQAVANYFTGPFVGDLSRGIDGVETGLNRLGASPFGQELQQGAGVVAAYFSGPWQTDIGKGLDDVQAGLGVVAAYMAPWGADIERGAGVAQAGIGKFAAYMLDEWPADFQSGVDAAYAWVAALPGKIAGLAGEFTSGAADIGSNIIGGIVQGLDNAAGGLFSAVRGIIQSALGAAEGEADIKSPSQVFADEVGRPIVEGVAMGIEDNLDLLREAAAQMGVPFQEEFDAIAENVSSIIDGLYADLLQGTADFVRGQVAALSALDSLRKGNADDSGLSDAQQQVADVDKNYEKALKKNSALIEKVAGKETALEKERQKLASDGVAKRGKLEDAWSAKQSAALVKEQEAQAKIVALRTSGGTAEQIAAAEQVLAKVVAEQAAIETSRTEARAAFVQEQTAKGAALDARAQALWAEREGLQQQTAANNVARDAAAATAATALQAATARKAQIDAVADDAERRTREAIKASKDIADPRERKLYLDTVTGFIEEEAQYKRDILTAETAEERTRLEERLKLVQEAQRTEAEIYARGAEERKREFDIQLAAAQAAAKQLGDFVYYSQEDAYGVGSGVAQGIATGLRDQLKGLGELIGTAMEESIKRARVLLGIASPSKVAAEMIGAPLADGISTGFMDSIAASIGSMSSAARAVVTPVASAVSNAMSTTNAQTSITNNYQYQPSYGSSPRTPTQDFAAMRALNGAR